MNATTDIGARIRSSIRADALAVCRLREKIWRATYPNIVLGISWEDIAQVYDFTGPETLKWYRQVLSDAHRDPVFRIAEIRSPSGRALSVMRAQTGKAMK